MSAATAMPLVAAQLVFAVPTHVSVARDTTWCDSSFFAARRVLEADTSSGETAVRPLRMITRREAETIRPIVRLWLEGGAANTVSSRTSAFERLPFLFDADTTERHLTVEEQNLFHAALRRSVKIVARGARL